MLRQDNVYFLGFTIFSESVQFYKKIAVKIWKFIKAVANSHQKCRKVSERWLINFSKYLNLL